jgi:hypothetical protein
MDTQTVNLKSETGENIAINVPSSLPTEARAEELRALWDAHVVELDGHWKGRVKAVVHETIADDVAEAMEFMGALVDFRRLTSSGPMAGFVLLKSNGYWAHGF